MLPLLLHATSAHSSLTLSNVFASSIPSSHSFAVVPPRSIPFNFLFSAPSLSGGGIGHPRRLAAEAVLGSSPVGSLTGDVLFAAINSPGDFGSDTIFQAIINVEKGVWDISQPTMPTR